MDMGCINLFNADWSLVYADLHRIQERSRRGSVDPVKMTFDGSLISLLNPLTAFVAGVVASLHCVGMCGPLSCSMIGAQSSGKMLLPHGLYHAGRLVSYSLLGVLAGVAGSAAISWFGQNPARYAPWAFVVFFLIMALGLDGYLTRWQARKGYGRGIVQRAYRFSGNARGLALGLATPLIPCGPLYVMLWATTMTGSAVSGAMTMAAFALGTVPLLLLAQTGWTWLSLRAKPQTLARLRRVLAFVAVVVISMRSVMDTSAQSLLSWDGFCNSIGL